MGELFGEIASEDYQQEQISDRKTKIKTGKYPENHDELYLLPTLQQKYRIDGIIIIIETIKILASSSQTYLSATPNQRNHSQENYHRCCA